MVKSVREAEKALGEVTYELHRKVEKNKKFARSLFAVKDIKKGEKFTEKNVRSIRPGYGMHPKYYHEILNNRASVDLSRGTPLDIKHLDS